MNLFNDYKNRYYRCIQNIINGIYNGEKYTLIDTAGIRRKRSVDEDVEYYSVLRAFGAIRRADVCLLVIDASVGITE